MDSLGCVHGYAVLWGEPSHNLAPSGEKPLFDVIRRGAIAFASDVRVNTWHIRSTVFASIADRTLEVFPDGRSRA